MNTLSYIARSSVRQKKSFITSTPGDNVEKKSRYKKWFIYLLIKSRFVIKISFFEANNFFQLKNKDFILFVTYQ